MLKIFFLIGLIQLGYINCQALYGQCGGKGYTGPTKCPANSYCKVSNEYYSQCVPGSGGDGGQTTKPSGGSQTTNGPQPTGLPVTNGKFPGCTFKWGRNWPDNVPLDQRKNTDYTQYDYVTKWIGVPSCTGKPSCTDFEDDQKAYLEMIKKTGKIPVMYGYVIAFEQRILNINDCDNGDINTSLCKKGANFIRKNKARILERYSMQASKVAEYLGRDKTAVFLIEPDFYQYYRKDGSHGVQQEGGPLTGQDARALFDGIAQAIKAALPNALISWDISPWAEDMETWWGFFKTSPYINFIHTSGGQARGDTKTIKDNNRATWAGMKQLTGKPIIADSGYGVGGGADPSRNGPWYSNSNVDARIRDGVIAETLAFSNRVPTYRNAKTC